MSHHPENGLNVVSVKFENFYEIQGGVAFELLRIKGCKVYAKKSQVEVPKGIVGQNLNSICRKSQGEEELRLKIFLFWGSRERMVG